MAADAPSPIPQSYRQITPALVVRGGADALDFYRDAFLIDPFGHS